MIKRILGVALLVLVNVAVHAQTVIVPPSTAPAFDATQGTIFLMQLSADVSSSTINGGYPGQLITIIVTQNGTGGWTVAWPANTMNPPTVNATMNVATTGIFSFDGTNWNGLTPGMTSGGGIGGTVSSPFVPYASGADTLSDSMFGYDAAGDADCLHYGFYDINADDDTGAICISPEAVQLTGTAGALPNAFYTNQQIQLVDSSGIAETYLQQAYLALGASGGFSGTVSLNDGFGTNGTLNYSTLNIGTSQGSGTVNLNGSTPGTCSLIVDVTGDTFEPNCSVSITPQSSGLIGLAVNPDASTNSTFEVQGAVSTQNIEIGALAGNLIDINGATTGAVPDDAFGVFAIGGMGATVNVTDDLGGSASMVSYGGVGTILLPNLASLSGTRFVCIGTDGTITSSVTPCSGT